MEDKIMVNYQGSCHCGAVRFSYEGEPIVKGLRCTCSICARKGAMMTSEMIPPENFSIDAEDDALGLYQFGIKTARHYFCKHCGIYTFHETARKIGHFRANIGCIDGVDPFALEADVFDGKNLM
ncbi:GFA family protein [Kaarinaea lacus]